MLCRGVAPRGEAAHGMAWRGGARWGVAWQGKAGATYPPQDRWQSNYEGGQEVTDDN